MFLCFSLNVYLPQNIDMSLSQVQWYSQNLEKKQKTHQWEYTHLTPKHNRNKVSLG